MKKILTNTGRSLLALYFLLPGIMKFVAWDMHIGLMEKHGMIMIPVLLALAAIAQIIGALGLMFNRHVLICSLGLAAMVLLINVNLHDFWNYSGIEGAHERQNFVKNLGIFAGLLLLAAMHAESAVQNNEAEDAPAA